MKECQAIVKAPPGWSRGCEGADQLDVFVVHYGGQ